MVKKKVNIVQLTGALLQEGVKHFLIELRSSNKELYVESDIVVFLINKFYLDYWEEFD